MKKLLFVFTLLCVFMLESCSLVIINDINKPAGDESSGSNGSSNGIITITPYEEPDDGYSEAKKILQELEVVDLEGSKTVFAVSDDTFFKGDGEETVVNSDRIARIKDVEQKLNTEIILKSDTAENIVSNIKKEHNSGTLYADVVFVPSYCIGILAHDSLITSLRALPSLELDAPYFSESSMLAASVGNNVYGISGDGCFDGDDVLCMYYNKSIGEKLGIDGIEEYVKSGKWTLDKYNEVLAGVDLGGAEAQCSEYDIGRTLLNGTGLSFLSGELDSVPAWNMDEDIFISSCQKLASVLSHGVSSGDLTSSDSPFCIGTVGSCKKYADSAFISVMLPLPKLSEEDEYISVASDDAIYMCVMSDHYSYRTPSDLIECFNAASYRYIREHYIDECVVGALRNECSVYSIGVILSNIKYDLTAVYSSGYTALEDYTTDIFDSLLSGKQPDLEKTRKKCEEYLEKTFPAPFK